MKRMLLLFAVAALTAAFLAPAALAAKPVPDPGCTFEKGKTTCVSTILTSSTPQTLTSSTFGGPCGLFGFGTLETVRYREVQNNVYTTTTTVYRGKTDTVLSTSSEQSTEQIFVREYTVTTCSSAF